ncbi:hypothetical protein R1flu_006570 [Riccia fluitans]|uniref:Uncharacterized protein n=1 Tax=Riccia fluitans TaxID=41844 RepID=A0ABD1YX16_9MARC
MGFMPPRKKSAVHLHLVEEQDPKLNAPMPESGAENPDKQLPQDVQSIDDEATHKKYEKMWHQICYGFPQNWKYQKDETMFLCGYMKLSKSKENIRVVEDEQNDFLWQMKNDDPMVVPQEDLLNHKSPIPAKLKLPPSFKEILEALRQEWYDPIASPFDGEPCEEELDLKRLAMEGVGGDHQWPNPYLQNMP